MSCEKEKKAVDDLQEQIADIEGDLKGATGQELHTLAARLGHAKNQLPIAQAALKKCASTLTGRLIPNYQILFVVYAPPGTTGGKSGSSVDYGTGSTIGSTTSTSQSFKTGMSISASVGASAVFASSTISAGVDVSVTSTDTSSIDVKKSRSWDIKVQGPAADGIDHDHDLYYLCLKPALIVTIIDGKQMTWGYDAASVPLEVVYVYGGWLKNPATMPPGVKASLTKAGLTQTDYHQVLAANPFSSGTAIDPKRFLPTDRTFPYEPPYAANDPVPTVSYVQKNEVTQSASSKSEHQYGVKVSVEDKVSFGVSASLKVEGSFQWTNSSTLGSSTLSSQSASVTVGGPSFGYKGPTDVLVYWDTIYNTFMFAFPTTPPVTTGHVADRAGHPVGGKEVVLNVAGHTFRTLTDTKGNYRIYGAAHGAASLSAGGMTLQTTLGTSPSKVDFKLPN